MFTILPVFFYHVQKGISLTTTSVCLALICKITTPSYGHYIGLHKLKYSDTIRERVKCHKIGRLKKF